jgi:hypothetical protein
MVLQLGGTEDFQYLQAVFPRQPDGVPCNASIYYILLLLFDEVRDFLTTSEQSPLSCCVC